VCDVDSLRFSSCVCRSLPCPCPFLCPPRPVNRRGGAASGERNGTRKLWQATHTEPVATAAGIDAAALRQIAWRDDERR
jgi:hypothetical protein